jgi:hypothetical protein
MNDRELGTPERERFAIPDELMDAILASVLRERKRLTGTAAERLRSHLEKTATQGFRRLEDAPFPMQRKELKRLFRKSEDAMGDVLELWRQIRQDLEVAAMGATEDVPESGKSSGGPIEALELALMRALIAMDADEPGENEGPEEIGGGTEEPPEDAESPSSAPSIAGGRRELPRAFEPAFELLRALPATDPCWEGIEIAVETLEILAVAKRSDPRRSLERLQQQIDLALSRWQDLIEFLQIKLENKLPEELSPQLVTGAEDLLGKIEVLFEKYVAGRAREPRNVSEQREKQRALDSLEGSLAEACTSWNNALKIANRKEQSVEEDQVGPLEPPSGDSEDDEIADKDPVGTGEAAAGKESEAVASRVEESEPGPEERGGEAAGHSPIPETEPRLPENQSGTAPDCAAEPRDDAATGWEQILWQMVEKRDLAGAFWLAESRAAAGEPVGVPAWLLQAACGAEMLDEGHGAIASELSEIANSNALPDHLPSRLLALGAGVRGALGAPSSGLMQWLEVPKEMSLPQLEELVSALREFAAHGQAIGPGDARGLQGLEKRRNEAQQIAAEVKEFRKNIGKQKLKLERAAGILKHLVQSDLNPWLQVVEANSQSSEGVTRVHRGIEEWLDQSEVQRRVARLDKQLHGKTAAKIVGDALKQLLQKVKYLCDLGQRWLQVVEGARQREARGDWFQTQIEALRERCSQALPALLPSLSAPQRGGAAVSAASRSLAASLSALGRFLALNPDEAEDVPKVLGESKSLREMLATRLLMLPGAKLGPTGEPRDQSVAELADLLVGARGMPAHDAVAAWLEQGDLRSASKLIALLPEEDRGALGRKAREAEESWRRRLRSRTEEAAEKVEQALVDGVFDAEERAKQAAELEAPTGLEEQPDFGDRQSRLDCVLRAVEAKTKSKLENLRAEWRDLKARLENDGLTAIQREKVSGLIEELFERKDLRLIEELHAQLKAVLSGESKVPAVWLGEEASRDVFAEFIAQRAQLEEVAQRGLPDVIRELKGKRGVRGLLPPGAVPGPRIDEAERALEAWRVLKAGRPSPELADEANYILAYLDFNLSAGGVTVASSGGTWMHLQVRMTDGGNSLLPQFGSQSRGRYDVVCVWERPGSETLAGWLDQLGIDSRAVLVLYFGRLATASRRRLYETAKRRALAMLVVDETLMLFLVGERDSRLQSMMACTLPYSSVSPYTPFQAGDVPPEMFFGRKEMLKELARSDGPCLLYGGRQLGKSAVLREVERQVNHPGRGEVACVLDIKLVGDPAAGLGAAELWPRLRDALRDVEVLSSRVSTDRAEDLLRHIREWVVREPHRRLLVMFDEADNFLDADAQAGFHAVTLLRNLMTETQRRFKVVLTGLHNVQRFNGIPNQPLAHFGGLQIEPLEPDAAFRLVATPFRHLGYRFEDKAAILRVLSYTNYHPGLVQLFCKHLLDRVRHHEMEPPYTIRRADIEAVYLNRTVQGEIRNRLEWTLALDPRYEVIAWSLVLDQLESSHGYARPYSRAGLLSMLRSNWPLGFNELPFDDLTGLLDEMRGLGVLVRDKEGRYRLRSPNLVRLMGTDEDILQKLGERASAPAPAVFDADSHRPLVAGDGGFSPLTHSQVRQLLATRAGVALVFASDALGLSLMQPTLRQFRGDSLEIAEDIREGEAFKRTIREKLKGSGRVRAALMYQLVREPGGQLPERVDEALQLCRLGGGPELRVVFVIGARAAHEWMLLRESERERLEQSVDVVLATRRWNGVGIKQWLRQRNKRDLPLDVDAVLKASGGWPLLLEDLAQRGRKRDELVSASQELEDEVASGHSELAKRLAADLGASEFEDALSVFRAVRTLEEVEEQELSPSLVEGTDLEGAKLAALCEYLVRLGMLTRQPEGVLRVEPVIGRLLA